MTTSEVVKTAQEELQSILKDAGLIDGESATREQISNNNNVLFWDTAVRDKAAAEMQIYLVWSLVSTNRRNSADDKTRAREAYASFDIYSRRTKTSKKVQDLISALDTNTIAAGWQFEFNGPAEYERDAAIYHIAFNLNKIYK